MVTSTRKGLVMSLKYGLDKTDLENQTYYTIWERVYSSLDQSNNVVDTWVIERSYIGLYLKTLDDFWDTLPHTQVLDRCSAVFEQGVDPNKGE